VARRIFRRGWAFVAGAVGGARHCRADDARRPRVRCALAAGRGLGAVGRARVHGVAMGVRPAHGSAARFRPDVARRGKPLTSQRYASSRDSRGRGAGGRRTLSARARERPGFSPPTSPRRPPRTRSACFCSQR
jgi:hypothetical protein